MNILVFNGSPKSAESNTLRLAYAFLSGMKTELGATAAIETIDVHGLHIEPCRGCFHCWTTTPGTCVIRDAMGELLAKIIKADLIIWSFPLYYYGMPSTIKALLDRHLPLNLPFITASPESGHIHPRRYENKPAANVVISTCGFYSIKNNYEALIKHCDLLFKNDYVKILCPEGELFSRKELGDRTEQYLSYVRQAGREYAQTNSISAATMEKLNELLYAPDAYMAMANASWDRGENAKNIPQSEKERYAAERFTRQMAAAYNPASFDGTERVLEIYYTDVKVAYQLVMGKERCTVRNANGSAYTTRVETPLTVWQDIANRVQRRTSYAGRKVQNAWRCNIASLMAALFWSQQQPPGQAKTRKDAKKDQPGSFSHTLAGHLADAYHQSGCFRNWRNMRCCQPPFCKLALETDDLRLYFLYVRLNF